MDFAPGFPPSLSLCGYTVLLPAWDQQWEDAVDAARKEKKQSGAETAANLSAQPNPVPH